MFLSPLQDWLESYYGLESGYDVYDFLITDPELARCLDEDGRPNQEKLLIDADDDGEAGVSLFLDPELVARLEGNDPTARLDSSNIEDFWTAFEGLSHFIYFANRASSDRPVTLLEMELQAEVDKFVATASLLRAQGERAPEGLHRWLFELPRFDSRLSNSEHERYERANHYAGKYCRRLWPAIARGADGEALRAELRYFYRLPRAPKIEHIGTA